MKYHYRIIPRFSFLVFVIAFYCPIAMASGMPPRERPQTEELNFHHEQMKGTKKNKELLSLCSSSLRGEIVQFAPVGGISAQEDDQTRRLWNSELFKPAATQPAGKQSPSRQRYRIKTPKIKTDGVDADTVLGVTLWRLRPSTSRDDEQVRLFKHSKDDTSVIEWTPERISVDTPLSIGQRVRLSIESARSGYLYVINREMYAGGTLGDPVLIFPTTQLRGGNNRVSIGQITDIPALEDSPSYFKLEPERPDLIGEQISVLVTPQPVPDLKIGEEPLTLSKEIVATWEQKWGTRIGRMELENSTGKAWTKEERAASSAGGQKLKRNSPQPQTLYYRPDVKSSDPLMIRLRLRYGNARPTKPPSRK